MTGPVDRTDKVLRENWSGESPRHREEGRRTCALPELITEPNETKPEGRKGCDV